MIFNLSKRMRELNTYAVAVANKIKQAGSHEKDPEIAFYLRKAQIHHIKYKRAVEEKGRLGSLLPGNSAFKQRVLCAYYINKAKRALNKAERSAPLRRVLRADPDTGKPYPDPAGHLKQKRFNNDDMPKVYKPLLQAKKVKFKNVKQAAVEPLKTTRFIF